MHSRRLSVMHGATALLECIPSDQLDDVLQELGWSLILKWTGRVDDSNLSVHLCSAKCPVV